ncbi:5-(carboxyamino)imidazole ribonucleotide synthase [Vagococcus penaei]|uniref:N5-carboxyaminoimidazole ribonucleotide synthase n=1 Tax=Vagococcus penaei TaxID=633807 RepID=A0A1Q2D4J1_9ENTE|nr:5-(carboxyamino)imidazole ribonucleotide synthase [Vagococcus penaei]AQP53273.1 5-(carboxyamino)imidazole ribonucleotide synthase [Vagococcus penaei]
MIKTILPGQVIGIIGGGQLGQMMAQSAKKMGFKVCILDPVTNCPASQVADDFIQAEYNDLDSLRKLAKQCDVVTYEFENIDAASLSQLAEIYLPQGTDLLKICQNRLLEKKFLTAHHFPIAPYQVVTSPETLRLACNRLTYPCVLKTTTGGYDGKGQVVLCSDLDQEAAQKLLAHGPCVLEKWISFSKELSVIVSGNIQGEYRVFPVVENQHQQNILHLTTAPAQVSVDISETCQILALDLAKKVQLVGTMAIELFLTETGDILINELAPRPHNSGHYSIEACNMSQFDLHIRGICGWSLPMVRLLSEAVMVNLIGNQQTKTYQYVTEKPDWSFHFYGKDTEKKGRKMGHITVISGTIHDMINDVNGTTIWK